MRSPAARSAALATAILVCTPPAGATDFFEFRGVASAMAGKDRLLLDLGVGAALDVYLDGNKGLRVGADALAVAFARHRVAPSALALAPDLALWFGADAATTRWFLVLRPITMGLIDLESVDAPFALRSELGAEWERRAADGSWRFRAGLFYAPGADYDERRYEWLAASLRVTLAWASPPKRLDPAHRLPGE
jgi:hypothetical protein